MMCEQGSGLEDEEEPADLIDRSLWHYERYLASLPPAGRSAEFLHARRAIETIVKAARAGTTRLERSVEEGALSSVLLPVIAAVSAVPVAERDDLINVLTPGLGAREPKWIFLGWEAAYGLAEEPNFTLEACLLCVLWKVQQVNGFHQHPYFLLRTIPEQAFRIRQRGHYWSIIAQLTKATDGRWGDNAYLVEISARPARKHAGGGELSEDRGRFLCELVRRSEAKVLVIAKRAEHRAVKERIAAAFLRRGALPPGEHIRISNGKVYAKADFIAVDGRLVVFSRHLSNSIADGFIDQLSAQIERRIARSAGPPVVRRRARR